MSRAWIFGARTTAAADHDARREALVAAEAQRRIERDRIFGIDRSEHRPMRISL